MAIYSVPLSVFQPYYITYDFPAYRTIFLISAYLAVVIALAGNFLYEQAGATATRHAKILLRAAIMLSIVGLLAMVQLNSLLWITTQREKTIKPLARGREILYDCRQQYFTR